MTCPARSKWGAQLCGSTMTSCCLWQKKPCWGFIQMFQWTFLVAQTVKHLPIKWETRVQPLGWEPLGFFLEKEMATHSSILAWKIPWMEDPGRLQFMGSQRVGHNGATSLSFTFFLSCPLSWWWHPTTLCHPLLLPPSISPCIMVFQMSQFFTSGSQSIGVSASGSVLPMNTQDWFALGWTGWISLQSKGLSRVFSNTTVQKHQFFGAQLSL